MSMFSLSPRDAAERHQPTSGGQATTSSGLPPGESTASEQKVGFLLKMADRFELEGNLTESVKAAETALLLRKSLEDNGIEVVSPDTDDPLHKRALQLIQRCNSLSVSEFQSGRYEVALFLLGKALFLTSASADTNCFGMHEHDRLRLRAATLNNLGCLEKRRDNVTKSLDYLQSAAEIETLVDADVGASPSTNLNLCTLFNKIGRHAEAIAAAERAIKTLQFQAQQGIDNVPQYVNMLMVAYYNLGVSIESSSRPGSISSAVDAYTHTLDIYHTQGGGKPSATAEAAEAALKRLRPPTAVSMPHARAVSINSNNPASKLPTLPISTTPLPKGGPRSSSAASGVSLGRVAEKRPATMGGSLPSLHSPRRLPTMEQNFANLTGSTAQRGVGRLGASSKLGAPGGVSSDQVVSSAAALGGAAMKHAARMQSKNKRKEEATIRNATALQKAQKAHKRDKEERQKKEQEAEAKRRDEMADKLYKKMVESMRTEEVKRSVAATTLITAVWRGYITRQYIKSLTASTIRIQSIVRAFLCRQHLKARVEEERRQEINAAIMYKKSMAAVILQTHLRRFLRRLAIIRKYRMRKLREFHAARKIQRGFRSYRQQTEQAILTRINKEKQQQQRQFELLHSAAAKIQGMVRSFKSRRFMRIVRLEQRRRTLAATKIQAHVRGALTRQWFKHYKLYRKEQEMSSATNLRAIRKIQNVWKMATARRTVQRVRDAAFLKERAQVVEKAALRIQCCFRVFLAKSIMRPLEKRRARDNKAAITVQCAYRSFKAREMYSYRRDWERKIRAVKLIQTWFRCAKLEKTERQEARDATERKRKEREALRRTGAAMCIQTYCYTALTRVDFLAKAKAYLVVANAATVVQRVGRGYFANQDMNTLQRVAHLVDRQEREFVVMTAASKIIQRATRVMLARMTADNKRRRKAAATLIQSAWRMHKASQVAYGLRLERQHRQEVAAVSTIQKFGREYLKKLELKRLEDYYLNIHRDKMAKLRRHEAATMIQAQWKGYATRKAVLEARGRLLAKTIDAMRIQRAFRTHRFRDKMITTLNKRIAERRETTQAAVKIQSFWRLVLAKEYVSLVRERRLYHTVCSIAIQCQWRAFTARKRVRRLRDDKTRHQEFLAARHDGWVQSITIVAMYARTILDQKRTQTMREAYLTKRVAQMRRSKELYVHKAATTIQSRYRGFYERTYVRGLRMEKLAHDRAAKVISDRNNSAAACIQRAFRCMVARVRVNTLRTIHRIQLYEQQADNESKANPKDVVKALFWQHEALIHTNLTRERDARQVRNRSAATKIQSLVRMFLIRKAYLLDRKETAERSAAKQRFDAWQASEAEIKSARFGLETAAATKIQSAARMFLVIKNWSTIQANANATSTLQRYVFDEESRDRAAIKIQSLWRGFVARLLADELYLDACAEKDARVLYEAARAIQRVWRGHFTRSRLRRLLMEADEVQQPLAPAPPPRRPSQSNYQGSERRHSHSVQREGSITSNRDVPLVPRPPPRL